MFQTSEFCRSEAIFIVAPTQTPEIWIIPESETSWESDQQPESFDFQSIWILNVSVGQLSYRDLRLSGS